VPASGSGWIHEIKHDGFRMMARRDGAGGRLFTRHGNDFARRFSPAVAATTALPGRSFLIDGEAIITNGDGRAVFELIHHKRHGGDAVLVAFDLIELGGHDSRREPIEHRKARLAKLVRSPHPGIALNANITKTTARSCSSTPASSVGKYRVAPPIARMLAALGEGQKSESASRNRDHDRSLARSFSAITARRFPPPRIG
jgi:ATP-dependent DNA ligase